MGMSKPEGVSNESEPIQIPRSMRAKPSSAPAQVVNMEQVNRMEQVKRVEQMRRPNGLNILYGLSMSEQPLSHMKGVLAHAMHECDWSELETLASDRCPVLAENALTEFWDYLQFVIEEMPISHNPSRKRFRYSAEIMDQKESSNPDTGLTSTAMSVQPYLHDDQLCRSYPIGQAVEVLLREWREYHFDPSTNRDYQSDKWSIEVFSPKTAGLSRHWSRNIVSESDIRKLVCRTLGLD